jgi:hypothetical protein
MMTILHRPYEEFLSFSLSFRLSFSLILSFSLYLSLSSPRNLGKGRLELCHASVHRQVSPPFCHYSFLCTRKTCGCGLPRPPAWRQHLCLPNATGSCRAVRAMHYPYPSSRLPAFVVQATVALNTDTISSSTVIIIADPFVHRQGAQGLTTVHKTGQGQPDI